MIEETLAYGDSFIHRIHPSVRIACAVILSFACAMSSNLWVLSAYLFLSFVFTVAANIPFLQIVKRLKPLAVFLSMTWLVLPVTFDGRTVFSFLIFDVTAQGLWITSMITVKSVSILLFFMALVATMTVPSMGHALEKLHVSPKMVFLILMSYRYIAVIYEEYERLYRAARIRGFRPGTNIHSYKTYAYLAGMLFVRASMRSKRVHQAMLCRGFNGTFKTVDKFTLDAVSMVFCLGVILTEALLVIAQCL